MRSAAKVIIFNHIFCVQQETLMCRLVEKTSMVTVLGTSGSGMRFTHSLSSLWKCSRFVNPFIPTDHFSSTQNNEWKSPIKLLSVERVYRVFGSIQGLLMRHIFKKSYDFPEHGKSHIYTCI